MKKTTVLLLLTLLALPVLADDKELGWKDTAELSLVATSGNSEAETFGFKNTLTRVWEKAEFRFLAAGLRTESTSFTRFAVGPAPGNSTPFETSTSEKTAENYLLDAGYAQDITDRLSWKAGAAWDRNRFAGIDDRYTLYGGVGQVWHDTDKLKFRTDYLLTYTDQTDVVPTPGLDDSFLGFRAGWDYEHALNGSTTYENIWIVDFNVDESDDWRSSMVNAVSVSMNKSVALKVSLTWLYDNLPALETVPLFDADPNAGGVQIGTDLFELDESDFLFTTSLVVDF